MSRFAACCGVGLCAIGSSFAAAQTPTLVKDLSPDFVINSSNLTALGSDGEVAYGGGQ